VENVVWDGKESATKHVGLEGSCAGIEHFVIRKCFTVIERFNVIEGFDGSECKIRCIAA